MAEQGNQTSNGNQNNSNHHNNGNGSYNNNGSITAPKIVWWLLGILATVVLVGGGGWMSAVNSALADGAQDQQAIRADQGLLRERLATFETKLGHLDNNVKETGQDVREVRRMLEDRFDVRQMPPKYPLR